MICSIWLPVGLLFHCVHLNIPRPADAWAWARVLATPLLNSRVMYIVQKYTAKEQTYSIPICIHAMSPANSSSLEDLHFLMTLD